MYQLRRAAVDVTTTRRRGRPTRQPEIRDDHGALGVKTLVFRHVRLYRLSLQSLPRNRPALRTAIGGGPKIVAASHAKTGRHVSPGAVCPARIPIPYQRQYRAGDHDFDGRRFRLRPELGRLGRGREIVNPKRARPQIPRASNDHVRRRASDAPQRDNKRERGNRIEQQPKIAFHRQ